MKLGNMFEMGLNLDQVKKQASKAKYFGTMVNKQEITITFFNLHNYIQIDCDGNIEGGAF